MTKQKEVRCLHCRRTVCLPPARDVVEIDEELILRITGRAGAVSSAIIEANPVRWKKEK